MAISVMKRDIKLQLTIN